MKLTLAFDIYNKEKWIASLLDSWLSNLSGENEYEFILVFDDLHDESKQIADEQFENYGYSYLPLFADNKYEIFCNNLALQHATGDYIIFTQDDNWMFDKNWDITLAETITRIPNLGVIGFLAGVKVFAPPIRLERIEANRSHKGKYFEMHGIKSCDLAVWQVDIINRPFCVSKQLLCELGGLDKMYEPTYGDDFDLSLKLLQKGRTNIYIPFDLVNTGGFKETLDRELFKKAKQEARILWQQRYGKFLAERQENNISRLWILRETPKGLKSHLRTNLCLGVQQSMKSISWLSVDVTGNPDIKDNAETLFKIKNNSCEVIVASQILEHLNYQGHGSQRIAGTITILKRWKEKLCLGGSIYIAVPDLDIILDVLVKYRNRYWQLQDTPYKDIIGSIYGRSTKCPTFHRMVYNFAALKYCLEKADFEKIKRLDGRNIVDNLKFLPLFNPSVKDIHRVLRIEAWKLKK